MYTYEYALIWHSQHGKEEIDCFQNLKEAKIMKDEYSNLLFFKSTQGYVTIKERRT